MAESQHIVPHLWFDKEASEAAEFYCSVFPDSRVTSSVTVPDTPSGDCNVVSFTLWGHAFMAISAGPQFTFNPSVSFMVNFDTTRDERAKSRIDEAWSKLSEGDKVLMPIDKYPFSDRYGWIQDKYGLSWQLILTDPEGEERPTIIPSLLFVGPAYGKAEEASEFYLSVFKNTKRGELVRYPAGMEPDEEGAVMFTDFMLENQWFAAMDSAQEHEFAFNEAVSFVIKCENQKEIDYYWDRLSADPAAEQCGWLKDRYGVSWQVVPDVMDRMIQDQNPKTVDRVTQSFLSMKKFDVAELQRAYDGAER
jgi:predicted 3-demethylubiquinone-9 3-methyltransferase (glyoxalase superfamily)